MGNLPLGFAQLAAGGILLTAGLTNRSLAAVVMGQASAADLQPGPIPTAAALQGAGEKNIAAGKLPLAGVPGYGPTGTDLPHMYGGLVSPSLHYAGPDQGVDFTGSGNIFAPVDLQIEKVDLSSGWPGGHLIVAKVLSGSARGRHIYFAEALNPDPAVKVGATIAQGQRVATLNSSYPGTEIGWARDSSGAAYGTTHDGKPGGPAPVYGRAFLSWLLSLHVPRPTVHSGAGGYSASGGRT